MSDFEYIYIYVCTTFLLLIFGWFYRKSIKLSEPCESLVLFLISFSIFTADICPVLYMLLSGREPDFMDYLRPWSWGVGLTISLAYWLLFLVFYKTGKDRYNHLAGRITNIVDQRRLFAALLATYLISIWGMTAIPQAEIEAGYSAANWILKGGAINSLLNSLLRPFSSSFYPASGLLIFYLAGKSRKNFSTSLLLAFSFLFLIYKVTHDVAMGGRGAILNFLFILFPTIWLLSSRKKAYNLIIALILIGILSSPFIMTYRLDKAAYLNIDTKSRLVSILNTFHRTKTDVDWLLEVEKIIYRFDGVQNGGNLALYSLENKHVFLRPYIGSAVSLIPRAFWPSKPQPKSGNGLITGVPQWKSGQISGRPYLCTSVSASSISFWHFNLFGIILLAFSHARLTRFAITLGSAHKRYDLFVFILFFIGMTESVDYLIYNIMQRVVPLAILFFVFSHFVKRHYQETKVHD